MTHRGKLEELCAEMELMADSCYHPSEVAEEVASALVLLGRGTPNADLAHRIAQAWRRMNGWERE